MSSGLKNLQTAARSYARRERMIDGSGGLYGDGGSSHPDDLSIDDFPSSDDHPQPPSSSQYPDPEHASAQSQPLPPPPPPPPSSQSQSQSNSDMRFVHPGASSSNTSSSAPTRPEDRIGVQNVLAQFGATGRLPSMDMGIDAIINRPSVR